MAASSLAFVARRGEPSLVRPSQPTPRELKRLSDLDDQESLRFYRPGTFFYRGSQSRGDPARIIRAALAEALVYYYPLAGRLLELPGRKLVVDCTGEGVWFIEADVGVALDELGGTLCPPVPCAGELLCLPESNSNSDVVVNRPLLYIQVTRFVCGGFVLGMQACHNLVDGPGAMQFLHAVGELARGMKAPSVRPVWARELFDARDPPRTTYEHPEYEPAVADDKLLPDGEVVHRAFHFGAEELSSLRQQVPPGMRSRCSRFLLLAAFMWRCRTAALGYEPGDEVRFMLAVNARGKNTRPLPKGFYGNALTFGVARTTAGELCSGSLGSAVKLIVAAMTRVATEDYTQSVVDTLVMRGQPGITMARTYFVSDITMTNAHEVDLGWGMPVYGGPATAREVTFHLPATGGGIMVPMCLPPRAMERMAANVHAGLSGDISSRGRSSSMEVEQAVLSKM